MSQYLDWKVGDRLVYVSIPGTVRLRHKNWRRFVPGLRDTKLSHRLAEGETYEIEGLTKHTNLITGEMVVCVFVMGFRFIEDNRIAFPARWFRKVQPRKTDISIFTAMLHDQRQKVSA